MGSGCFRQRFPPVGGSNPLTQLRVGAPHQEGIKDTGGQRDPWDHDSEREGRVEATCTPAGRPSPPRPLPVRAPSPQGRRDPSPLDPAAPPPCPGPLLTGSPPRSSSAPPSLPTVLNSPPRGSAALSPPRRLPLAPPLHLSPLTRPPSYPLSQARPAAPQNPLLSPSLTSLSQTKLPRAPSPPRTCAQSSQGLHAPAGFAPNHPFPSPRRSVTESPVLPNNPAPFRFYPEPHFPGTIAAKASSYWPSPWRPRTPVSEGLRQPQNYISRGAPSAARGLQVLANKACRRARLWTTFPRRHAGSRWAAGGEERPRRQLRGARRRLGSQAWERAREEHCWGRLCSGQAWGRASPRPHPAALAGVWGPGSVVQCEPGARPLASAQKRSVPPATRPRLPAADGASLRTCREHVAAKGVGAASRRCRPEGARPATSGRRAAGSLTRPWAARPLGPLTAEWTSRPGLGGSRRPIAARPSLAHLSAPPTLGNVPGLPGRLLPTQA